MMMFTFSISDHKYPFWANLVQKLKMVEVKLYTKTNWNMENVMVVSILSVLDWK